MVLPPGTLTRVRGVVSSLLRRLGCLTGFSHTRVSSRLPQGGLIPMTFVGIATGVIDCRSTLIGTGARSSPASLARGPH